MQENLSGKTFTGNCHISSFDYLKACLYILKYTHKDNFTKKVYLRLIASSQLLEDFLDFHGAKNNKTWYYYRELAATVRHLSLGGYTQKHILNRLVFYDLPDIEEFQKQGEKTLGFLNRTLVKAAHIIIKEAENLNIEMPEKTYESNFFPSVLTNDTLPYDIDDEDKDQQAKNIVNISSQFLSLATDFEEFIIYEKYDHKRLKTLIPDVVNEVSIRKFEMMVHNLQSSFDTYVIHGGFKFGNRKLKQLRSYFSVVFHLLQIVGRLLHFYERHLLERGYKNIYKKVKNQLSSIVDQEELLDRTINFGLYYACHYLTLGKELASEILNENIKRASVKVGIPVKLGFHSRPSLLVAKIVRYYGGDVQLLVGDQREFDASSVLDIQWAGGLIQKEGIEEVVFIGDKRALKDIEVLASVNYGEDTFGKGISLPKELAYLK